MAQVKYVSASRVYAKDAPPAVNALDLDIKDGEFMVLVGPSGSGKTTALRMLAGLEPLDGGRVEIGDRDVTFVPPKDRDIAMVFQNYALYPQKTVAENMGFALKMQGVHKDERARRVQEAAKLLDLDDHAARPQAEGPVRRAAAAGGDGTGHRARAEGLPDGRAAVQPGRQAARADPQPDRRTAAPPRGHHRLRDPRPGGGHDHGPPGRGAGRRAAAAVRHAPPAVRQPGEPVRRRVHRLARDEPADGPARRGRRPAGRHHAAAPARHRHRGQAGRPQRARHRHPARAPAPGGRRRWTWPAR